MSGRSGRFGQERGVTSEPQPTVADEFYRRKLAPSSCLADWFRKQPHIGRCLRLWILSSPIEKLATALHLIGIGLALLIVLLLTTLRSHAQSVAGSATVGIGSSSVIAFAGVPSGACTTLQLAVDSTTGNLYACNLGAWLKIGPGAAGSAAWDSITNPTTGGLTLAQFANGDHFWTVKRNTDTLPTGSFFRMQTAAGADLCKLDISGTFSACTFPNLTLNTTAPLGGGGAVTNGGSLTFTCTTCLTGNQSITLTGDATGSGATAITTTVAKVNGIAYSATAAAHSVEVVTTANTTATAKTIPDCTDTTGNHLNFTQSTDAFSCGTSAPAAGNLTGAVTSTGLATVAGVRDLIDASAFCSAAGANTTTYTCSLSPAIASYVTGTHYRFKADVANTAASTINFNSLGAKTIKKAAGGITTDLVANDLVAGQWVDLVYDGTNMQMQSLLGNAPGAGSAASIFPFVYELSTGTMANATSYYYGAGGNGSNGLTSTEGQVQTIMAGAGTVAALAFYVNATPNSSTAGATITLMVRKGAADTTVTCTVTTNAQTCTDTAHSFTFSAGDLLDIKLTVTGGPVFGSYITTTLKMTGVS